MEHGIREGLHPGAQLYVSLNGQVLANLAFGEAAAGHPMTTRTVNVWFSSGKPITAIASAILWERGVLDLDATVASYVPEFGVHGKEAICLRHLLNHTGGFRGADRIPGELPWDEAISAICSTPIESNWVPGRRAGYQLFSSWFILGEVIRRIDGRALDRFVQDEIFRPVEMSDCWMVLPADRLQEYGDRIGVMHFFSQGQMRPHPVWNLPQTAGTLRPGGNVRGPLSELGRFYEALLGFRFASDGGRRLVSPDTLKEFTSRQRSGLFDETFQHLMDWGLGFGVNSNQYGPETVPYGFGRHASGSVFGHGGSQSSCGFADPEHGLVAAWLCNGMIGEPAHQRRARQINDAIYEDLGLARQS